MGGTEAFHDAETELSFDVSTPAGLTTAMATVPALIAFWVERLEVYDSELAKLEARAFERESEAGLVKDGKLPAIERVKVRVCLDPAVDACQVARAHAKAMVEGLKAKRDMLISAAALMREEMRQELRVNE